MPPQNKILNPKPYSLCSNRQLPEIGKVFFILAQRLQNALKESLNGPLKEPLKAPLNPFQGLQNTLQLRTRPKS